MTQRFATRTRVDHYLGDEAPPNVWRRHGLTVLSFDIPLHLHLMDAADEGFATEFVSAAASFLRTASPAALEAQGHLRRRLIKMLLDGDIRSVRAMSRIMGPRRTRTLRTRFSGVRLLTWRDRTWLVAVGGSAVRDHLVRLARRARPPIGRAS